MNGEIICARDNYGRTHVIHFYRNANEQIGELFVGEVKFFEESN